MYITIQEIDDRCQNYQRIAIWPSCYYAGKVLDQWENPSFEERCYFFNSNPELWGRQFRGKTIHGPSEILQLEIDAIIIMNYRLQDSIWLDLSHIVPPSIAMIKFHHENDVNWFEFNE